MAVLTFNFPSEYCPCYVPNLVPALLHSPTDYGANPFSGERLCLQGLTLGSVFHLLEPLAHHPGNRRLLDLWFPTPQHGRSEQVVAKEVKTYAAAANYIIKMKPNTYHDYIMCMAKESTVTFVKFEKGGGPSDFILKYSGLPTTKSIKGSFIESQLNYIGTMVEQERANTLKKKLHKDCLEEMKDWASGQALLDLNPDLYVQAYVDDQRAGRLEKGKLISWQCTKTDEWQILENINSTNCTRNTKVAFRHTMDDSVHEGYVERQTGRIVENPGAETPCSEKDHVLAIGNGMLLKYDVHGKTTVYAEQVVIRTPTSFMEAKPAYTDYDGSVSLMERVVDLEEDRLVDTDKGFIYKGMDKFVNTSTGLVSILKGGGGQTFFRALLFIVEWGFCFEERNNCLYWGT